MGKGVDDCQIDRKEHAYFYDCFQWRPRQIEWYHPNRFQTEHSLHYIYPIFDYSQRSHSSSSCLAVRTRRIHSWSCVGEPRQRTLPLSYQSFACWRERTLQSKMALLVRAFNRATARPTLTGSFSGMQRSWNGCEFGRHWNTQQG